MKKLSLLMALLMFSTIGGVYATWSYSIGGLTERHHYIGKIQLTDAVSNGAKGAIEVDYSTLSMLVDNAGHHEGTNYTPKLLITGNIVIKYTPAHDNPGPIDLYYHLGMSIPATDEHIENPAGHLTFMYGDPETATPIFTKYDNATKMINKSALIEHNDGAYYTYTITAEMLAAMIIIDNTVVLDDYSLYQAYNRALGSVNYGIAVGEYVATPTPAPAE